MLMAEKFRVHRSAIFDLIRRKCGTDLTRPASEPELVAAIQVLERIKADGLPMDGADVAEPDAAADKARKGGFG
jgi:hypothetical protein